MVKTGQELQVLEVLKSNSRYFTNESGKAVYLTGSHTWDNFKDAGITDPPAPFDYTLYLDYLEKWNHNFFRLWSWELPKSTLGSSKIMNFHSPFPWPRTGPGMASDGKPRFDLTKFHEPYFDRMRERIIAAGNRGMYVAVMMFEGHGLQFSRKPGDGFPLDGENNVNDISCNGKDSQALLNPQVTAVQESYVRKAMDTVNDLDNILYEIVNEAGPGYSTEWQYHFVRFIKEYQRIKGKEHPVGMTFQSPEGSNKPLFESPADWISPGGMDGFGIPSDPPAADGGKIIINDTDHSVYYTELIKAGVAGQREWVWKNFMRGNHVIFMDPYLWQWPGRNEPIRGIPDPRWDPIRLNMGYTRIYAEKMDLAVMAPHNELASTGYCLASPAAKSPEYLVYVPAPGTVGVDVSGAKGRLVVEWFDPVTGITKTGEPVEGGNTCRLRSPFEEDSVLYISKGIPSRL